MTVGNIGDYYDADNVLVGSAVGFVAPVGTADPADSLTVFDPAVWLATSILLGGPTAGNFKIGLVGGKLGHTLVPTANIAYNAIGSAIAAAVQAILPSGYVASVSGGPANSASFKVVIDGPAAEQIVVSVDGTGLTGGSPAVTLPAYAPCGATEQGWQVNWNPTTQDINIDEQPTPVDQQLTTGVVQFAANLSEDIVASWGYALNADKTVIAPASGVFGKVVQTPNRTLKRYKVVVETQSEDSYPTRYIVPKMTCAANVGAMFKRAAGQRLIPVTFTSICDFSQIQRVQITAAPLP